MSYQVCSFMGKGRQSWMTHNTYTTVALTSLVSEGWCEREWVFLAMEARETLNDITEYMKYKNQEEVRPYQTKIKHVTVSYSVKLSVADPT